MTGPHMREGGDLRSGISRAGSNRKWTGMIRYDSEASRSVWLVSTVKLALSRCRPKSLYGIIHAAIQNV